jgi:hypothetical protein
MLRSRKSVVIMAVLACLQLAQTRTHAQQSPSPADDKNPSHPVQDEIEIPVEPVNPQHEWKFPSFPEIKIPNFSSCSIEELKHRVPELAHVRPAPDQVPLPAFLDEVGKRIVEIARKTPNLISHETVISDTGGFKQKNSYSFLVLQHSLGADGMVFDEYRVDTATGKKFEMETSEPGSCDSGGNPCPLPDIPALLRTVPSGEAPQSQGFINGWLRFYPANRAESVFRLVGWQNLDKHKTEVIAFAQKPGSVRLPLLIGMGDKKVPVYMQGIAWIDASDFRILRLHTDILAAPPGVPLRQLSSDVRFVEVRVPELPSPLWLASEVLVITNLAGNISSEDHTYSNYRLFRAKAKIILSP